MDLMGLEFCTMIPGTVGGALAGNAGAGGHGICEFAKRVLVLTRSGRAVEVTPDDYEFGYRYSELSEAIILEADFELRRLDQAARRDLVKEYVQKKKGQPYDIASSGCIFKNPVDPRTGQSVSAGKIIDELGLKGYALNAAMVSDQHANFIVNRGGATGEDFLALITLIQDIVFERTGIELHVEARMAGGPMTSCVLR